MNQRIAVLDLQQRHNMAAIRGQLAALHATIRGEVDAKLAESPLARFLDDGEIPTT
jgi:hypothetical protein